MPRITSLAVAQRAPGHPTSMRPGLNAPDNIAALKENPDDRRTSMRPGLNAPDNVEFKDGAVVQYDRTSMRPGLNAPDNTILVSTQGPSGRLQ